MGLLTTRSPHVSSRAPSHRRYQPASGHLDPATAYFTELHRHVVRLLSSRPFEADDVAQTVMVRYWEHRHMLIARSPAPQRFARVVTRLLELGCAEVSVGDTIGEMGLFFRLAPVVCVGGSLVPHGGQNPIEAIKLGAYDYVSKPFDLDRLRVIAQCG